MFLLNSLIVHTHYLIVRIYRHLVTVKYKTMFKEKLENDDLGVTVDLIFKTKLF